MHHTPTIPHTDDTRRTIRDVTCLAIGAALAVFGYATIALFLDLAAQV